MVKKQKYQSMSFIENGVRWLQCNKCHKYIKGVTEDIVSITCSRCLNIIMMNKFPELIPEEHKKKSSGRPPGWHWMKEFVDKDGNVFHKGKEQTKLKGTLPPTKVKPPKKRKRLTADEKLFKDAKKYKNKLKIKRDEK